MTVAPSDAAERNEAREEDEVERCMFIVCSGCERAVDKVSDDERWEEAQGQDVMIFGREQRSLFYSRMFVSLS